MSLATGYDKKKNSLRGKSLSLTRAPGGYLPFQGGTCLFSDSYAQLGFKILAPYMERSPDWDSLGPEDKHLPIFQKKTCVHSNTS